MKNLLSILTLVLFTVTANAQPEPYVTYSAYSQSEYNVSVGSTWGIGSDNIDVTSFIGLTNRHAIFGSGIDVVSGNLVGIPLFLGADLKYGTSSQSDVFISTPKIGFRVPVSGSHITLFTSFDNYNFNTIRWRPLGLSISF
jgi:hypothetical protein